MLVHLYVCSLLGGKIFKTFVWSGIRTRYLVVRRFFRIDLTDRWDLARATEEHLTPGCLFFRSQPVEPHPVHDMTRRTA